MCSCSISHSHPPTPSLLPIRSEKKSREKERKKEGESSVSSSVGMNERRRPVRAKLAQEYTTWELRLLAYSTWPPLLKKKIPQIKPRLHCQWVDIVASVAPGGGFVIRAVTSSATLVTTNHVRPRRGANRCNCCRRCSTQRKVGRVTPPCPPPAPGRRLLSNEREGAKYRQLPLPLWWLMTANKQTSKQNNKQACR